MHKFLLMTVLSSFATSATKWMTDRHLQTFIEPESYENYNYGNGKKLEIELLLSFPLNVISFSEIIHVEFYAIRGVLKGGGIEKYWGGSLVSFITFTAA